MGGIRVGIPLSAQSPAVGDRFVIAGLRAWLLREPDSGRRYTIVRIEARDGAFGFGEGGPVRSSNLADARSAILGRRATALEFVRQRFAAAHALEAAISNAFVDLAARSAGVPVFQYLGGPVRFKARLLAHFDETNVDLLDALAKRALKNGFRAYTLRVPPRESMTRLQAYVDSVRGLVDRFKNLAGASAEVVLDGHGALLPGDAAVLGRSLERVHPIWFDEPTGVLTNDALSRLTDESVMPVGLGRNLHDIAQFQNLLRWGCVDVLRPSLATNSLHKIKRMAAIAETHYVAVAPFHNGGPLATAFGIHLAAALPNFFIQQVPLPRSERDAAMRSELLGGVTEAGNDGFAPLVNQPGVGVHVNEPALAKYSEETV